jgi:hypothetical protein
MSRKKPVPAMIGSAQHAASLRVAAHVEKLAAPAVTRAELMAKLDDYVQESIADCKRELARCVASKVDLLAMAAIELESVEPAIPGHNPPARAMYTLKNLYSGMRTMYEANGKLRAYLVINERLIDQRTTLGDAELVTDLLAYNAHQAMNDSSYSDISSSDMFSNAIGVSMAEGQARGRRDIHMYLTRTFARMADATS